MNSIQRQQRKQNYLHHKQRVRDQLNQTLMYPYQHLLDFREIQYLPKVIAPNENIIQAVKAEVPGKNNGTGIAVLTNQRVVFLNHRLFWGSDYDDVDLSDIQSISPETRLLRGSITITNGERKYIIDRLWKWHCVQFGNAIQQEKVALDNQHNSNPNASQTQNVLNQLQQLHQMLLNHTITPDEFNQAKQKILGNH